MPGKLFFWRSLRLSEGDVLGGGLLQYFVKDFLLVHLSLFWAYSTRRRGS